MCQPLTLSRAFLIPLLSLSHVEAMLMERTVASRKRQATVPDPPFGARSGCAPRRQVGGEPPLMRANCPAHVQPLKAEHSLGTELRC